MPEKNAPNLEQLKKQSKELHHAHQTGDDAAIRRVAEHHPRLAGAAPAVVRAHRFTLSDAQLVIAREHNCASWPVLKEAIAPVAAQAAHDKPSARMTQPEHLRGAVLRRDGVTVDGDQAWALFCACADGDLPVVRQLITANPDLNYAQIWYVKPIALAMGGGHTRVVELLLQHDKAHRLARGVYGHNGQWIGRREVLRRGYRQLDRAVMRYKHARAPRYSPEFHTLQEAIETRDLNRINTVLDATPALLHATDLQGNGALHLAVFTRQLEIVEDILDRGAEIDCERGDGVTPLLASLDPRGWGQAMAITSYLLARGARYTLSAAAAVGHAGKLTQALREAPEAIRDLDANEYSPLRYAALGNHATVLRILLEHGADPNRSERDAPQGGALWWACRSDSRDAIRLLLAHGAAAHAEYDSGGCCLSIYSGSDRIAQLLRDHGAFDYPYMMDTAKMKQAVRDNLPVVRYLGHHYWVIFIWPS